MQSRDYDSPDTKTLNGNRFHNHHPHRSHPPRLTCIELQSADLQRARIGPCVAEVAAEDPQLLQEHWRAVCVRLLEDVVQPSGADSNVREELPVDGGGHDVLTVSQRDLKRTNKQTDEQTRDK